MTAFDFVIIGSGTAGGTLAHCLTQAGAKCALIEAGRSFAAEDYPRWEMQHPPQLFYNGGADLTADGRIGLFRGKCVGGGSVVNQALLDRFSDDVWSEWRQQTASEFWESNAFAAAYERIEKQLQLHTFSAADYNRNATLFADACDQLGYGYRPLLRAQGNCDTQGGNDCLACVGGCRRASKQSIPVAFLPQALQQGLQLHSECEVLRLSHERDGILVEGLQSGRRVQWRGRRALLCAGALGTAPLLLRSGLGDALPALGQGFFCHPQVMTFALMDEIVDAHKGSFQCLMSDEPRFRDQGFKLENVFAPATTIAPLLALRGKEHLDWMRNIRRLASVEVSVRDVTPGTLRLDRRGNTVVAKRLAGLDKERMQAGLRTVDRLFAAMGALRQVRASLMMSFHLLGGCKMGNSAEHSVIGSDFSVHGLPNLYVMDSSVFPSAPGINPALTIMAMAQRCAAELCTQGGGT